MEINWTDRVENEVLRTIREGKNFLHTRKLRRANWIGHILRMNCLLEQGIQRNLKGRIETWHEDEEEDVRSYWINLRKREDIGHWKRRHWIALCGELALEVAMDQSPDRLSSELINDIYSVRKKFCCRGAAHVKCESESITNRGCNCNSPRTISEVFTTLLV